MCLNKDGSILATASETGTIIRLFKTKVVGPEQPKAFQEVRRGSTNANIQSLVFDNLEKSQYLACSSDRDTIHIFVVEYNDNQGEQKKNPTGGVFGKILGSNESRSFAQLKIGQAVSKCGFSEDGQQLVVITLQGQYYESEIPNQGGNMKIKVQHELLAQKPLG